MLKDDRFYAFIVERTSRSRSRIRRIAIRKRWLKIYCGVAALMLCAALYGIYGLAHQAARLQLERENERLRALSHQQLQQLNRLENRLEAIEDASRRLAEISGVPVPNREEASEGSTHGAGGPEMDEADIHLMTERAAQLEETLRGMESQLLSRVPSFWPAQGNLTDSFGGRRNPMGGSSYEFHSGLDISAPWGAPVYAAGSGRVISASAQNGYGLLIEIDHGNGVTTRYAHLSLIEVSVGQEVERGAFIGRIGSTGRSTGPHLHYEVRMNDSPVNPRRFLPN